MNENNEFNEIEKAQNTLLDFAQGPASNSAQIIALSFKKASKEISNSLFDAAKNGELSMKSLVNAILKDLQNLAIKQFITKPIESSLQSIFANIPQYGARASGGPVNAGGAYLVGENGPEYFVPKSSGNIQTIGNVPINININLANGAQLSEVKKSASQISVALARAVNNGMRR